MSAQTKRLIFWGIIAAIVLMGLVYAFRPRPAVVDLYEVQRGKLVVTVDDEGQTRIHDVYVLSAPVDGRMKRLELHAGDPVRALETVVAEFEPIDAPFLDPRTEAQAEAAARAAESAEALAFAQVEEAQAEVEFGEREFARAQELQREGTIAQRDLDEAERRFRTGKAALATAIAALDVRKFELERARAALVPPGELPVTDDCACVDLRAPASGSILRILQQSEGIVTAGTPLVEVGDPRDLEIVVDLLSSDAVRVEPGQRVIIERWGGDHPLSGIVRLVEPFGYTKVSALGIEEQRVNVIVDITSAPSQWKKLAHGYQVDVRIIQWEDPSALTLPLLALFRDGAQWAVFVAKDGQAELRQVAIGRRSRLEAEIVGGLSEGESVVLHPSDRVQDGVRITERGG